MYASNRARPYLAAAVTGSPTKGQQSTAIIQLVCAYIHGCRLTQWLDHIRYAVVAQAPDLCEHAQFTIVLTMANHRYVKAESQTTNESHSGCIIFRGVAAENPKTAPRSHRRCFVGKRVSVFDDSMPLAIASAFVTK
jgi:hypothetical protein